MSVIKPSKIEWKGNTPISKDYDDVYFSVANGLAESRYVFLEQNDLPGRWQENQQSIEPFTIFETGFGTGLNFLATWQEWINSSTNPTNSRPIHFISIEKHPLSKEDLEASLTHWPELQPLSRQLIEQYPHLIEGQHLLSFENSNVQLTLIFGDAHTDLDKYSFSIDCWFLDGFAPSKNPDMWSDVLFQFMTVRSKVNATFSTFTAAGKVRRGLQGAGFNVIKHPGFGHKREMLKGRIEEPGNHYYPEQLAKWSISSPYRNVSAKTESKANAIVVGAGLAGLTTARCLAEKGLNVTVIEKEAKPCSGASGQEQLAQYAKLPTIDNKEYRYTLRSLLYSQRYFDRIQAGAEEPQFWNKSGLLQLAWNENEENRLRKIIQNHKLPRGLFTQVEPEQASKLAGLSIDVSAGWFPDCGWLDPRLFGQTVIDLDGISLELSKEISSLEYHERDDRWQVETSQGDSYQAEYVVIATANNAKSMDILSHLPSKPLRGQVTSIETAELKGPDCILCGEGYLCPSIGNKHHFGATYDLSSNDAETRVEDRKKNISTIKKWLPGWLRNDINLDITKSNDSAGLRCTTPDYMPIVGAIPKEESFTINFPKLRHNANAHKDQYGDYYPNLFLNIGHGSKGLVTTPLCAEYISSLISGGPLPFDQEIIQSLSPSRFIIKELTQRKR